MQLFHGVSSLVVVGRKVTSCLYTAARIARRFLLVLGGAFDARKLRCASPAVCGRLKEEGQLSPIKVIAVCHEAVWERMASSPWPSPCLHNLVHFNIN